MQLPTGNLKPRQMQAVASGTFQSPPIRQLFCEDRSGRRLVGPSLCLCIMIKHKGKGGLEVRHTNLSTIEPILFILPSPV